MPKTTSYLRSEELLAKYPGRLAAINAALAHCYIAMGLAVPPNLINKAVDKNETRR